MPQRRLGKGGGGEVWAVRDAADGREYALKILGEEAGPEAVRALVRELSALSGLEGLGVPRVHRFGRLAGGKPYLLRDMVAGQTLEEQLRGGVEAERALGALVQVAAVLTRLHRASRLHGDIKPANIVVDDDGRATLVDLGLAAAWREQGAAWGMTPGYGAPELARGEAPSAASDVFALGATLRDVIGAASGLTAAQREALGAAVARATAPAARERYPSADELGEAIRSASGAPAQSDGGLADAAWPVEDVGEVVDVLRARVVGLGAGRTLALSGRSGSGKSAVLRRLCWALGVEGERVGWVEARAAGADLAVEAELDGASLLLVDDAGLLGEGGARLLREALARGARLVVTDGGGVEWPWGVDERVQMPPLSTATATRLLLRARPSLSEAVAERLVAKAEGRPGRLRSLVARLSGRVVVGVEDVERLLRPAVEVAASSPAELATRALDQGRLPEAKAALASAPGASPLLRARLLLAEGDAAGALAQLAALDEARASDGERRVASLYRARAALVRGDYGNAIQLAGEAGGGEAGGGEPEGLRAEAEACAGVAESFLGRHDEARTRLTRAVEAARRSGDRRVEALALSSLGLARQRGERPGAARAAYEEALEAAEEARDAGAVATIRLNLAALSGPSELAAALAHLEAAVEMGQQAGRASTVRQAMLNLVSLDLTLGRLGRARGRLAVLAGQRGELSEGQQAQLLGLEAEAKARAGEEGAAELYERCAAAYGKQGRRIDAAEARVEAALYLASEGRPVEAIEGAMRGADEALTDAAIHQAPLRLARALVAQRRGDVAGARSQLDRAIEAARAAGQREWLWQIHGARAALERGEGRGQLGQRERDQALSILEEIASELPRDLREVYWSDPRRAALRGATLPAATQPPRAEDRLERILGINRELAVLTDPSVVLQRVLEHATALVGAERGHALLLDDLGALSVRASQGVGADEEHRSFSRSIAERAISTGEPLVTLSARDDERMKGYESVHLLDLQSVACVPIRSPRGGWIGALYLEARRRPGATFDRELPALCAFADQAAIAIEHARLLAENRRRSEALEAANLDLEAAKQRLRELLDQKRAQLESTRRDLKDTRAALRSHFGYHGLVGTSAPMRRLYALIDRVKEADIPVLITGESGTGKEMVARAIHDASARAKRPFTGVNCGAIPEHLLESELFGHVRGAFTGAERDRRGLFRETDGGSLLLDEIGEMPTKMQAGLLRVLQERSVRPVGGLREEPVDVRVIAATHRDLEALVAEGRFREDLLYRLRVVEIRLPPLRERPEDIPVLIDHFLQLFAARYRRDKGSVSREALRRLSAYPWPGNVRQLQNALLNAWVLSESDELGPDAFDLPAHRQAGEVAPTSTPQPAALPVGAPAAPARAPGELLPGSFADHQAAEKARILQALQECSWNRVKAAQVLQIPRRTFYRRLREYGIQ